MRSCWKPWEMPMHLPRLAEQLARSRVFAGKKAIDHVRQAFGAAFTAWDIANGDDAAAIPDGAGSWLLLAAEGVLPELAQRQPELAGRSAVLANVNDIYAMGGRPLAMVDVVGAPEEDVLSALCKGMRDNALRFGVPIVGGHVQAMAREATVAIAILGRAKRLVTSFDAAAGDALVLITNLDGIWLRESNYWNCTLPRHDGHLQGNLELVPQAAEDGLVQAGRDISMAGIAGTLVMLCECSRVGARLDLDALQLPAGCEREQDLTSWLRAFFSYGFLFAVRPALVADFVRPFQERGLHAAAVGECVAGSAVMLQAGGETVVLHDWSRQSFTGF